jgi:hypothetical protein
MCRSLVEFYELLMGPRHTKRCSQVVIKNNMVTQCRRPVKSSAMTWICCYPKSELCEKHMRETNVTIQKRRDSWLEGGS